MHLRKLIAFILILVFIVTLSGCWDSVEINKRAFVLGIGLDSGQTNGAIDITYEIALPEKLTKPGGGDEGGGGGGKGGTATWNITKESNRVLEASHTVYENIDKVMDLEHMQLLVIGTGEAQKGIFNELDYFFRRPQMRRRTKVVYFDGNAKDFFDIQPKTTKSPSMFISELLDTNNRYSNTVAAPVDLGGIIQTVREGMDFSVVRVSKAGDQLAVNGEAAFSGKTGAIVGFIDEGEVGAAEWLNGRVSRGNVLIPDPHKQGMSIVYEITEGKSQLKPVFDGDKLSFDFKINVEGDLGEKEDLNYDGTLELSYIQAVQNAVEDKIRSDVTQTFNKYIKEKKVDIFGLQRKVKNYNIRYYDKNKNKIDDLLAQSNINIKVDAKVRRVGAVK